MATMNISLPNTMKSWVETQVETGKYANASDYVRDLIRHNIEEIEVLRQALIEGEQSGTSPNSIDDIIEALNKEHN
ncbi:MAG: type II toxin-antitoxin system ParD family antitoxin [Alphaproteobacteria bacterium]